MIETATPVKRESLTEQTVRGLREAILDGTFALGQKLRESDLVARFAVSSSVIREALHVLQGEGMVVTKPYCGRSVFSLGPEEGAELQVIRASLESYAAYLAAGKITPDTARRLRAAAARFISDSPDAYSEWVDRELSFHRTVWEAAGNEWLARQLNQCSMPLFTFTIVAKRSDVRSLWRDSSNWEKDGNPQGHQVVTEAIVAGRAQEARELMLRHTLPHREQVHRDIFQLG
jgi:DNA-binding GntR family transcriptional regulator